MVNYLHKRLRSERGASFSFSLFVFLVCCAVSSIVLAAATASSGQFAQLSKFDQRYYSVTSAASLFQDELDKNGEVSYSFVETSTGTNSNERTVDDVTFGTPTLEKIPDHDGSTDKLYFLYDITKYALYGPSGTSSTTAKAFDSSWWELERGTKGYKTITSMIEPTIAPAEVDNSKLVVSAEIRLRDDWTAEVVLSNTAAEPEDKFSLYLSFAANMEEDTSIAKDLQDTDVSGDSVTNGVTATKTHATTVTWRLRQIVPGRGFAND